MNSPVDCNNCGNFVLPGSGGLCPSCGKNVNDETIGNLTPTKIYAKDSKVMPEICIICGGRTEEVTYITRSMSPESKIPFILRLITSPFSTIVKSQLDRDELKICIPVHKICFDKPSVIPKSVDYDRGYMTLNAHKNFRLVYNK